MTRRYRPDDDGDPGMVFVWVILGAIIWAAVLVVAATR